jgi:hypothetical protein
MNKATMPATSGNRIRMERMGRPVIAPLPFAGEGLGRGGPLSKLR